MKLVFLERGSRSRGPNFTALPLTKFIHKMEWNSLLGTHLTPWFGIDCRFCHLETQNVFARLCERVTGLSRVQHYNRYSCSLPVEGSAYIRFLTLAKIVVLNLNPKRSFISQKDWVAELPTISRIYHKNLLNSKHNYSNSSIYLIM